MMKTMISNIFCVLIKTIRSKLQIQKMLKFGLIHYFYDLENLRNLVIVFKYKNTSKLQLKLIQVHRTIHNTILKSIFNLVQVTKS